MKVAPMQLEIGYSKHPSGKVVARLGFLEIASITYSEACCSWFVNFYNISNETWECKSKASCDETIKEKAAEFINDIIESCIKL